MKKEKLLDKLKTDLFGAIQDRTYSAIGGGNSHGDLLGIDNESHQEILKRYDAALSRGIVRVDMMDVEDVNRIFLDNIASEVCEAFAHPKSLIDKESAKKVFVYQIEHADQDDKHNHHF